MATAVYSKLLNKKIIIESKYTGGSDRFDFEQLKPEDKRWFINTLRKYYVDAGIIVRNLLNGQAIKLVPTGARLDIEPERMNLWMQWSRFTNQYTGGAVKCQPSKTSKAPAHCRCVYPA